MITSKFSVSGMTCQACVEKVSAALKSIPHVSALNVDLVERSATLHSSAPIQLEAVKDSLASIPKYSVNNFSAVVPTAEAVNPMTSLSSKLQTYKPLIVVFAFILIVSLAYQLFNGSFDTHLFMNHVMAGFFIGLSFFKFLDLNAFAESFSGYDPVARRILAYGLIYPFIELSIGVLFISGKFLLAANIFTILILSATTVGVIKRLQSKTQFQCACLGTAFSLPLSNVTVFENVVMIAMAAFNIYTLLIVLTY